VQLIATSALTGHFCDASGDAYLDVFSCKDLDPEIAIRVVQKHFRPKLVRNRSVSRRALSPGTMAASNAADHARATVEEV
jgi:S-adenosylmethionine/arginine decarboxylase-like enzyme